MAPKRKRFGQPASTPARKRSKKHSGTHPHGEHFDQEKEYHIRSILNETATQYQIAWADDPVTGKPYSTTWEPKSNANQAAIDDWERQKAERREKARNSSTASAPTSGPASKKKRGRGHRRKIAESSPEASSYRPSELIEDSRVEPQSLESGPEPEPEPEIGESQQTAAGDADQSAESPQPIPDPSSSRPVAREGAIVRIPDPPLSWAKGAYERVTSSRSGSSTPEGPARAAAVTSPTLQPRTEVLQSSGSDLVHRASSAALDTGLDGILLEPAQGPAGAAAVTSSAPQPSTKVLQGSGSNSVHRASSAVPNTGSDGIPPKPAKGPAETTAVTSSAPQPSTEIIQGSGSNSVHRASSAVPNTGLDGVPPKSANEPSDQSLSQFIPDSQSQQDISGLTNLSQSAGQVQEGAGAQEDDQEPLSTQEVRDPATVEGPIDPNRQTQTEAGAQRDRRPSVSENQQDEPGTQLDDEEVAVESQEGSQPDPKPFEQPVAISSPALSQVQAAKEPECSDVIHEPTSDKSAQLDQDLAEPQNTVITSSSEDHSGQSSRSISPIPSKTPPRTADFEPPPAGQPPLPSSRANGATPVRPASVHQPTSSVETSSFPFQTQLPLDVQNVETAGLGYSSRAKAAIRPHLPPAASRDSAASSRSPSSSPFPSLPSRPLGTLGESAPQPFGTFSPSVSSEKSTMDSSSKRERVSFAAELKAKRDQRRATSRRSCTPNPSINMEQPASALPLEIRSDVAASQVAAQASRPGSPLAVFDNTRSPSMVPAVEPSPVITKEAMNTSERYETTPQAQLPRQNGVRSEHEATKLPRKAVENSEEARAFTVPVAPSLLQRDQYKENIYYESDLIEGFLEERHPSPELIAEADKFLDRLQDIAMHPDLINPETLSQTAEPERQAKWDVKCSAKFHFLDELINRLQRRAKNTHIAVVAKGQRLPSMVENFLNGTHVPNRRVSKELVENFHGTKGVRVSVVDLNSSLGAESLQSVDLVIALDASIDAKDPRIRTLRRQKTVEGVGDAWSILLTLVMPKTVEHMKLCLHKNLPASVATRMLMKAIKELKYESGRLEGTQASVKDAAAIIADYLDDEDAAEWPLAELSQLEELDSQTETDIDPSASHETGTSRASKRLLEEMDVDADDTAKRTRQFSPKVQDMELTHVSDSLEKNTSVVAADHPAYQSSSVCSTEQQLRDLLQNAQHRLDEHVKALEDLQYRYEDQRKKLVEVTRERDSANNTAQLAVQRMTGSDANNTTLRAERTQLKEALAEANKRLLEHSVPERAEFEQLRALMEQVKMDKDKAEKRMEATQKELEWTRSMYQDTSSRAIELANQNRDLDNRLAVALNKAQGEAARAREISVQGHNQALGRENSQLRLMLQNRDAALKFKDEEIARLKDSGRGRMGTMPPRSPRMGSSRGSRAASPDVAAKKVLHPLRQSG
ncbi:hypothetical protein AC578_9010 [Pseudocercospora eumusae]|uniref:Chromo domain-containing protein n=1 Tax=Pseudocercospora eumusae TaxID=321146 RepID=A0A139H301_9PEZI|nr:hypothetical protein AC578_9010 [Pseudocercospora eumusae]